MRRGINKSTPRTSHARSAPYAYIAAPFTAAATAAAPHASSNALFDISPKSRRIPKGPFRRALLAIDRALRKLGLQTVLPHRDANKWGKKHLSARRVFLSSTKQVLNCKLFAAILGRSTGAHYEYGVAVGAGKLALLFDCSDISPSFVTKGIKDGEQKTLVIRCHSLHDIGVSMKSKRVADFVRGLPGRRNISGSDA